MREERKLNKAIMRDGAETQRETLEELKRRYPQFTASKDSKKPTMTKRKKSVVFALAAVAACAAVIVPCAVLLPNNSAPDKTFSGSDFNEIYLCPAAITLKEYRKTTEPNILYLDWYDEAIDICSTYYIVKDEKTVGIMEDVGFVQAEVVVQLTVYDADVHLKTYDWIDKMCKRSETVDGYEIKYAITPDNLYGLFEYGGYRYIICLERWKDKNGVFDVARALLEKI